PIDLQARVKTGLENAYGPGLTALFTQNPVLIGGMRIKVGSDVYDNSVRSALAELARGVGSTYSNLAQVQHLAGTGSCRNIYGLGLSRRGWRPVCIRRLHI